MIALDEWAWMIGEEEASRKLTPQACRLRETRLAAAVFKRRWPLLIRWRQQAHRRAQERKRAYGRRNVDNNVRQRWATGDGEITITTNLPRLFPILRDEMAILRAFLSREVDHILFGDT
ncbi:MAG: hypothetical protein QM676_07295 [Novosphingobium sp.]